MKRDPGLPDAAAFHPDVDEVQAMLRAAAAAGEAFSYSEILMALGSRFTRPRMRALCRVLDAVDQREAAAGQPELAVFVVREGDRLPGQGWWVGRIDYAGPWTGAEAMRFVGDLQRAATAYWSGRQA